MTGRRLTYAEAVTELERALTFGINPSLEGIEALTRVLSRPQDSYASVQVTGTNGKTSVTQMTGALLAAHGLTCGAYTSPHLVSYTERITVDGRRVAEEGFAEAVAVTLDAAGDAEAYTEFELLTAAALWHFAHEGVAWSVLEVGMGGRWDATSVVMPAVAGITGVGLDHTERLGPTREAIAADKAHIIKPGSVAVLGPGCAGVEDIFFERTLAVGAPSVRVGRGEDDVTWEVTARPDAPGGVTRLDVIGIHGRYDDITLRAPSYQAPNAATAVAAAEAALDQALDPDAVRAALAACAVPGRFELLRAESPLVIDGAHNPQAAGVLAGAIAEAFGAARPSLVLAVLADKDAEGIVRALKPVAGRFVVTENGSPRCLPADALAAVVESVTGSRPLVVPDLAEAVEAAAEGAPGVVVTGSLYTAGAVRALFGAEMPA
ncbi:MAG TPA: Mur ligase family protein [Coriobacteriia bacterium]|nr:Mur ligase family protein [Coriobacteriia bacterium]